MKQRGFGGIIKMEKVEISKEQYEQYKDTHNEKSFITSLMSMRDYVYGTYDEKLIVEDGKYFASWKRYTTGLD